MYNFIIIPCDSQGGCISARAFALTRPGMVQPLNPEIPKKSKCYLVTLLLQSVGAIEVLRQR